MRVLSIQSAVTYGHVGNSAAVFPLQRIGNEVWPIYTVTYSNHTGYGAWRGRVTTADEVRELVLGVEERGELGRIDLVLSGYLGNPDIADAIVESVARVKELNPKARYACDPVMGSADTGCFVAPEIPVIFRDKVIPITDIITPNQFELGFITDTDPKTTEEVLDSIAKVQELGPEIVLVTSVEREGQPADTIEMIAADREHAWSVRTPRLDIAPNGAGDVVTSLFVGHLDATESIPEALGRAASGIYALLETTVRSGERELQLIAAQENFANPRNEFEVTKIR